MKDGEEKTMTNIRASLDGRASILWTLAFLVAFLFWQPLTARAQWTAQDASGNINSTNTGNVGVGTTTPAEKLSISGSLRLDGTSQGYGRLIQQVNGGNQFEWYPQVAGLFLYDRTAAQYRISILNNGNVGIGTTSPMSKLEVVNPFGSWTASNYLQITGSTTNNTNIPGISFKGRPE
jgi:hypothetical protein